MRFGPCYTPAVRMPEEALRALWFVHRQFLQIIEGETDVISDIYHPYPSTPRINEFA